MKPHQTINCENGDVVSLDMVKLMAEDTVDEIFNQLRTNILQGTPLTIDSVWAAFNPEERLASEDAVRKEVRSGIYLSVVMGISHAMSATLKRIQG